jgi:hypothetical protein
LGTRTNATVSGSGASGGRSLAIGRDRRRDEALTVGLAARNRDEQVAVFDRAAVRRHPADGAIGMAGRAFGVRR